MYSYLNAVLDANPDVAKLVMASSVFAVATGPVPQGEQSIPGRVSVSEDADAESGLCVGFSDADALICQFFA
jgi:hypothetical protein